MDNLMTCPVCMEKVVIMERGRKDNLFWASCACGYEGPSYTTREEAIIMHNDQCALIAEHLAPRSERDTALAELAALKAKIERANVETVSEDTEGYPVIWEPFNCKAGDRVRILSAEEEA